MPTRWRALWLPATLPVSSFTHTPPSRLKPRARSGHRRSGERRDVEAACRRPPRTAPSSERTSSAPVLDAHAVGRGERGPRRTASRTRRAGFGSSVGRIGPRIGTRSSTWWRSSACVRAAPRPRRGDRHEGAADRAAPAGDHAGSGSGQPRPGVELADQLVPHGREALAGPARTAASGGPRTPRAACPAARPTCSSRG